MQYIKNILKSLRFYW